LILVGWLGTTSGTGIPAIAIGVVCVVLMLPSVVILGVGVVCL